jgi:Flp pilus assembly pilin Flp
MGTIFMNLLKNSSGVTAIEYSLIAAMIAIAVNQLSTMLPKL